MAGGTTTTTTTHQPPQLISSSSSSTTTTKPATATTTPEEDEVLKRNTDCVYFLASPLTCKKGSECEYRHSDVARVNPRDCWYWLNGSCLNPKCAFRHPPLDGLLGTDVSTPVGPSVPPPHPTPYAMPKQGVACIFFQKGYCLKGHLCPFVHGPPNSVNNNKAGQPGLANPIPEPPKMSYSGPEKSFQDQKITQPATAQKPVEFPVPQAVRMQAPPPARNGGNGGGDKKAPPVSSSVGAADPPRYKSARVVPPPVVSETPAGKPNRGGYHHASDNDRVLNGKDADEYSREPSPGFDVLVDNELGDSEYYRNNKDEFGRSRGNEYDLDRPADYDVDREMYRDYDHYNERQGERYAWDEHRSSSERVLVGSAHLERRSYPRSASPDHFDGSDLRHRISKQRRVSDNGLRSVVSREGRVPRRDRDSHHHDDHHRRHRQDQGGLSSRLRGRIKIPERSVSPNNGRPLPPSVNHGRLRDRIKDTNNDPRDYKGFSRMPDNESKFAGPKRLSELKKGYEQQPQPQVNDERQSLGKRKYPNEEDLSFEGPKPLSEILKSKRGSETTGIKNNSDSHVNNKEKRGSEATRVKNNPDSHVNNEETNNAMVAEKEENNSVAAVVEPEKVVSGMAEPEKQKYSDSAMDEDALLDEELEGYEEREGEYEYVEDGEEEYNLDEEGEYVDEEEYANENENENENGKKEESVVCL